MKLYGALLNSEKGATSYFDTQLERLEPVLEQENTGKTLAFFAINANGMVTVRKPGDYIAKSIELILRRGLMTLIDPNGAGKSTISKSLIRQLPLTGGTEYLGGKDMSALREQDVARQMSVLMTGRIHPELMTCIDVAATGRYPYTGRLGILSREDHEKTAQCLELVHSAELADQDLSQISDGQRQRVLLARALNQDPEVLVLDEPTSFLDIRYKLELLSILKDMVRARNLAVIMSLHELDLAQKFSDRVVCVHRGVIARRGTPEEIFTPDYIAQLYGTARGSYNPLYDSLELDAASGPPEVFVIGGGAGIPVYRRLQRQGIPFAAGVLGRGDSDYPVARTLAVEIVEEDLFQPIGDEAFRRAVSVMERCGKVLCQVEVFGEMNQKTGSSGRLPRRPESCSAVSGHLGSSISTSAPLAIGFFFSPCRMFFHNSRTSD